MSRLGLLPASFAVGLLLSAAEGRSGDLACFAGKARLVGEHDRVCVSTFDDPKVAGVTCYVSIDKKGGVSEKVGLEASSRYSMECRQVGPVSVDLSTLPEREDAFALDRQMQVIRIVDVNRKALVYLAISTKSAQGSHLISAVPITPASTKRVTDR